MMHRKGTTLVEVLVAIFIMAIGTLAILAMFPLGVISMARAIQDDRTGHSAANARAIAEAQNIRFDPNVTGLFPNPSPNAVVPPLFSTPTLDQPSYPVYVDPIGFYTYTPLTRGFIGGTGATIIPRTTLSFIDTVAGTPAQKRLLRTQNALRWCSLLDDITFSTNAVPDLSSGTTDRAISYSWGWMVRLPKTGTSSDCEVTVVVYSQRAINTAVPSGPKETAFPNCSFVLDSATGNNLLNVVTLTWSPALRQAQPRVEEGNWILDATPGPMVTSNGKQFNTPGHSTFYRVVSVSDEYVNASGLSAIDIELAQPMQGFTLAPGATPTLVVMDGVVEVFQSSGGWRTWSK